MIENVKPENYVLSFKATGVSVYVTDIHKNVYKNMHVLFIISNNTFYQYFPIVNYNKALDKGLRFYKNSDQVNEYINNLLRLLKDFRQFFLENIKGKKHLPKNILRKFFSYTTKLCTDYTKMNIEYTDKAFSYKNQNKTITKNLEKTSLLKDKVRLFMDEVLFENSGFTKSVFYILSKQFHIAPTTLENLTQTELIGLYGQKINPHTYKNRRDALVVLWNQLLPFEGKKAKTIISAFQNNFHNTIEARGQIANKGKVTGRVKIINVDYTNLSKLKNVVKKMGTGNILITGTTAPELILACKKAGAIVTDLGGLMSHAAIISRELNIPCIVGTKIATKIFKDGDMVEVNADKGIVRKIRK